MVKSWIKRNWYRYRYKGAHLQLGKGVLLDMNCQFEGWNVIGKNCEISTSIIGKATYISANAIIRYTHIGRFCSIGSNLQTGLGNHPTRDFVSTHPAFFSLFKQAGFSFVTESLFKENKFVNEDERCIVRIGNDVWIGNNVTILDGLTIGDGAVIGTGAVVTQNVEPYAIVTGLPAKVRKYRFAPAEIERLLTIKWWSWDMEKIQTNSHLFKDVTSFIKRI
ncbi:CatB-related O-acetyltransferase [Mucilaginibacter sabulilitoris]|uniref:CatB-related O-acetyltransferase n=1 Tax=Mucilaginibacter sabulilitoris TaxID=1173583 RepID=A0ABZ0TRD1_9SPHI|nr:CatB-related O-acetyltransferase [Mucilaginibacter sabulilitoris]WPU95684.1 CatB-related O-acetyltransferase [Mucilaginibacter sabulilitoris]